MSKQEVKASCLAWSGSPATDETSRHKEERYDMKRYTYEKDGSKWSWWDNSASNTWYCTNIYGEGVFEIDRGNLVCSKYGEW